LWYQHGQWRPWTEGISSQLYSVFTLYTVAELHAKQVDCHRLEPVTWRSWGKVGKRSHTFTPIPTVASIVLFSWCKFYRHANVPSNRWLIALVCVNNRLSLTWNSSWSTQFHCYHWITNSSTAGLCRQEILWWCFPAANCKSQSPIRWDTVTVWIWHLGRWTKHNALGRIELLCQKNRMTCQFNSNFSWSKFHCNIWVWDQVRIDGSHSSMPLGIDPLHDVRGGKCRCKGAGNFSSPNRLIVHQIACWWASMIYEISMIIPGTSVGCQGKQ
jgi:hypothetical protein